MKAVLLDPILMFIIIIGVALLIGKALNNWYHEIEKRSRYMEAQIRLLAHTAIARGVNKEKVHEILLSTKLPYMNFENIENIEEKRKALNEKYN